MYSGALYFVKCFLFILLYYMLHLVYNQVLKLDVHNFHLHNYICTSIPCTRLRTKVIGTKTTVYLKISTKLDVP